MVRSVEGEVAFFFFFFSVATIQFSLSINCIGEGELGMEAVRGDVIQTSDFRRASFSVFFTRFKETGSNGACIANSALPTEGSNEESNFVTLPF